MRKYSIYKIRHNSIDVVKFEQTANKLLYNNIFCFTTRGGGGLPAGGDLTQPRELAGRGRERTGRIFRKFRISSLFQPIGYTCYK